MLRIHARPHLILLSRDPNSYGRQYERLESGHSGPARADARPRIAPLYIYTEAGANCFDTCILTTKFGRPRGGAARASADTKNAPVSPAKACGNTAMLPAPTHYAREGTRQ